jgi:hypothetical protein
MLDCGDWPGAAWARRERNEEMSIRKVRMLESLVVNR